MPHAPALYLPDKYNVYSGQGTVGFCTVWNEPKAVLKQSPELLQSAAIVGTLYSPHGVNAIVRNLALNPWIRRLYIWGRGPLSQTKIGALGTKSLVNLWKHGINADHSVPDSPLTLEQEIEPAALSHILQHVELIDLSQYSLSDAVQAIEPTQHGDAYMKPVSFPEAIPVAPSTFPSEAVGFVVRGRTVIETWTRVVERVLRYGHVKGTQYGQEQKELIGMTWIIEDEDPSAMILPTDWPKELQELVGATQESIEQYHQIFLSEDKPAGVAYTYGNRLMQYPIGKPHSTGTQTLNQVKTSIIGNLAKSLDTRRAVATTLVPWIDSTSDEPPCITQVQCIHVDGKLHMLVTARSHDIFKAAIPNAFGLRMLHKTICADLEVTMGSLQITSQSAHIYEPDWDHAQKLVSCAIWDRPASAWDGTQADPRGIFLVRVQQQEIIVEAKGPKGESLLELKGRSADALVKQLAKLELFSQSGHALDIGVQLARAELAARLGIAFVQDRPLAIPASVTQRMNVAT